MVLSPGRCHGSLVSQPTCLECLDLWFITMSLDKRQDPPAEKDEQRATAELRSLQSDPTQRSPGTTLSMQPPMGCLPSPSTQSPCQSILAIGKYYGRVGWSTKGPPVPSPHWVLCCREMWGHSGALGWGHHPIPHSLGDRDLTHIEYYCSFSAVCLSAQALEPDSLGSNPCSVTY